MAESGCLRDVQAQNLEVLGDVVVTGELKAPVAKAPVENGDANLTVTEALHAGTIVMQTNVAADRTYTIPAPSVSGVSYRFLGQGTGAAADGHDIILSTSAAGATMSGLITHLDTGNEVGAYWGNGENTLQINVPAGYDISMIAKSTSPAVYYVTGTVTSATAPSFTTA